MGLSKKFKEFQENADDDKSDAINGYGDHYCSSDVFERKEGEERKKKNER